MHENNNKKKLDLCISQIMMHTCIVLGVGKNCFYFFMKKKRKVDKTDYQSKFLFTLLEL